MLREGGHHDSPSRHQKYPSTSSTSSAANERESRRYSCHNELEDEMLSDETITSMTLLARNQPDRRRPLWIQRETQKDDFYVKVAEAFTAWWKTRRKTLKTHGRLLYAILREAFYAKWTIQLQIVFLIAIFVFSLVFTIHIYHHSHLKPYPWREHCASQAPFPTDQYTNEDPVGILVGVMTTANPNAAKRRQEIRDSWASHWASRGRWKEGDIWAGLPQGNGNATLPQNLSNPTSRVVIRFVMGRPKPEYRAAIQEEIQKYHDIVIVPMRENMNDGKTFAFFDWSFKHSLVPPPLNNITTSTPSPPTTNEIGSWRQTGSWGRPDDESHPHGWAAFHSYESRPSAPHDPLDHNGRPFANKEGWVRPEYVVKADDDSFIMLAELEARLRVLPRKGVYWGYPVRAGKVDFHAGEAYALSWDLVGHVSTYAHQRHPRDALSSDGFSESSETISSTYPEQFEKRHWQGANGRMGSPDSPDKSQPRKYRNKFLDLALPIVGREDQVTAGWMKTYGKEWGVTWYDDRCWIYDHAKSGTVYSKGFLFPSEVQRIREEWGSSTRGRILEEAKNGYSYSRWSSLPEYKRLFDATYSTVLRVFWRYSYPFAPKWDTLYRSPLPFHNLNRRNEQLYRLVEQMKLDALIEGSSLSMVVSERDDEAEIGRRWKEDLRKGWRERYLIDATDQVPIGGTVVVHYVKLEEYWRECVDILLDGWPRERRLKEGSTVWTLL